MARPGFEVDRVDDRPARVGFEPGLQDVRLGAVEHQRRLDRRAQALDDLDHLLRLVGAFGQRDAHVQQVRAAIDLGPRHLAQFVVLLGQQQPLHGPTALRVDALANEGWRRLLAQVEGAHGAGRGRRWLAHAPRFSQTRALANGGDDRLQVVDGGAAAAADRAHAQIGGELAQRLGQLERLQWVHRVAAAQVQRDTGIGNDADRPFGALGQKAHRFAHVLGPGRAVQADDVDVERVQNRERRADVGAQQHAAVDVERDLDLNRDASAGDLKGAPCAEDGGLGLQNVLLRLDDQQVGATQEQAARLLFERLLELREGDVRQRRVVRAGQEAARADGAGHEARAAIALLELVAHVTRQARAGLVEVERPLGQAPLLEAQSTGLEGVGLDDVAADVQKAAMQRGGQVADDSGTAHPCSRRGARRRSRRRPG